MCNYLTPLAYLNDERFINICEHGTVHFSWDLVVMFMRTTDLAYIQYALEHTSVPLPSHTNNQDSALTVVFWYRQYAIRLQPFDFLRLRAMVHCANKEIDCEPADFCPYDIKFVLESSVPTTTFSLN